MSAHESEKESRNDHAYPEKDRFGRIWLDRNVIISYDRHLVPINGEELLPSCTSID